MMEEFEEYEYPNYDDDLFNEYQEYEEFKDIEDYLDLSLPDFPETNWTTKIESEAPKEETTKKKKKTTNKETTTTTKKEIQKTYTTTNKYSYVKDKGEDSMDGILGFELNAVTITILVCLAVLPYLLFIVMASHVSVIKKQLKETNEILMAMIKEQRRVNDHQPTYHRQEGQAQQMESIEPPKL